MSEIVLTTARVQTEDGEDLIVAQVPFSFVSSPEESAHTWLLFGDVWEFPLVLVAETPSGDWMIAGDKKYKRFVEQRPFSSFDWRPTKISTTDV